MARERVRRPAHFVKIRQNLNYWLSHGSWLEDIYDRLMRHDTIEDEIESRGLRFTPVTRAIVNVSSPRRAGMPASSIPLVDVSRDIYLQFITDSNMTAGIVNVRRENPFLISPRIVATMLTYARCHASNSRHINTWLHAFTTYSYECVDGRGYLIAPRRGGIDRIPIHNSSIQFIWSPEKRRFVLW